MESVILEVGPKRKQPQEWRFVVIKLQRVTGEPYFALLPAPSRARDIQLIGDPPVPNDPVAGILCPDAVTEVTNKDFDIHDMLLNEVRLFHVKMWRFPHKDARFKLKDISGGSPSIHILAAVPQECPTCGYTQPPESKFLMNFGHRDLLNLLSLESFEPEHIDRYFEIVRQPIA